MNATTAADPLATSAIDPARRRAGRRTLLLLAFVCVLPVAASYIAYYVWQPAGRANYGELLTPAALPAQVLPGLAGQGDFAHRELLGQWTLLYAGPAACEAACADMLYLMRQSRLAQAKEMERVARLWLVTDRGEIAPARLSAHAGLRIARAVPEWLVHLPAAEAGRHVYLVDPLGNVMMRFPADADPRRVIKDLQRLLKYSGLGRR